MGGPVWRGTVPTETWLTGAGVSQRVSKQVLCFVSQRVSNAGCLVSQCVSGVWILGVEPFAGGDQCMWNGRTSLV